MATIVVPVNKEITFTDTSSNLDALSIYKWNFGDASPELTGKTVKHTYTLPATYYPTHEVKNGCGTVYQIAPQKTIEVIQSPSLTCFITSCPPTNLTLGDNTSISASWIGGTAPYTVQLVRDGVAYGSVVPVSGTSKILNFQVVNTWIGTHTVAVRVNDSSSISCITDTCIVNVTEPKKYKCVNGTCVEDPTGTFTEPTCNNSCVVVSPICTWITNNGGVHPMRVNNISTLIRSYLGYENIGFTVTASYISGVIAYYSSNLSSGNNLTGCNFT